MLTLFKQTVRPTIPADQRVYAVGDVHGRLDLLKELMAKARADNEARSAKDVSLVFLGDLVDRGPHSRDVTACVREGVDWARTVAIMGNHEASMLAALDGEMETLTSWLQFGGTETLLSWGVAASLLESGTLDEILAAARKAVEPSERAWLGRMRGSLRVGDYYFVHAGIRPGVALEKQLEEDRLWIRDEFLTSRKRHGAVIVHGHTITRDVEMLPNRIGIDTGAYQSGKLTALGLDGDDRWLLTTGS